MKILVCISRTPDTTTKITFIDNNTKFETNGIQWIINPYDEWYALVRAIEIKEADPSTVIHLVHVGLQENEPIIRKALALGGDEAFRIDTDAIDAYSIAFQIASMAKDQAYDIILTGKETLDHNNGATGGMIAAMLDINCIGLATKLELENNLAIVTREVDGGEEILESPFPLLIACQKGMADPRIPNMRGIMAARTKPLHTLEALKTDVFTETVSFSMPAKKAGITMIPSDQSELLVKLLREEAKVI